MQQEDLLRGARVAKEEYGLERLYENCVDAVACIRGKDDRINDLLDEVERLTKMVELAAEAA